MELERQTGILGTGKYKIIIGGKIVRQKNVRGRKIRGTQERMAGVSFF
jgi:hypothetical protein